MTDLPAPPPRDPDEPDGLGAPDGLGEVDRVDEIDELASALVDGLLPPDEAVRARHDPAVVARVERIEHTRASLRATPPPDPAATDRAITAALDAFDAVEAFDTGVVGAPPAGPPPGEVTWDDAGRPSPALPPPIPLHRDAGGGEGAAPPGPPGSPLPRPFGPDRSRRGARAPWLAAAAAIVAVLLAVGLLSRGGDDEDLASQESREEAPTAADAPEDGEARSGGGGSDAGAAAEAPSAQPNVDTGDDAGAAPGTGSAGGERSRIPHLGQVSDGDELTALIATSMTASDVAGEAPAGTPAPTSPSQPEATQGTDCPGLTTTGDPGRGTSTYVADATLDATPVRVHVYETPAGPRLVATTNTCTTLLDQPYTP
jgi:hypothetical protein